MSGDHDLGLAHDLGTIFTRRRILGLMGAATASSVTGCDALPFFHRSEPEVVATGADGTPCVVHPSEVEGPFPADGSNRAHGTLANVLRESGIVRKDMRSSLNAAASAADGVELRLRVALVSVGTGCQPLAAHAVYLWHCDAVGHYSVYDVPDSTYLRAVGVSDQDGMLEFVTIVPGCYEGRYPHMHFEVYPSLDKATDYRNRLLTSQLAIPADVCTEAYKRHAAYGPSIERFAKSPLERDMIFRDNTPRQLAAQTLTTQREDDGSYSASVKIGLKSTTA
jgi:protocatechuate 3,4-dioxygenase beta subunit